MLKLIEPFDLIKVIPNYFQTDPRCPTILPASPHFYFCNFLQIAGFQSFDSRADNMQISFARNCFCFLDLEHLGLFWTDIKLIFTHKLTFLSAVVVGPTFILCHEIEITRQITCKAIVKDFLIKPDYLCQILFSVILV